MTDPERRGRLELAVVFAILATVLFPPLLFNAWQAGLNWRAVSTGVLPITALLLIGFRIWQGDRIAARMCMLILGLAGLALIIGGVAQGAAFLPPPALAVYRNLGIDAQTLIVMLGAILLFAALALVRSRPIHAFLEQQRARHADQPNPHPGADR
jgi:hypothetical protein